MGTSCLVGAWTCALMLVFFAGALVYRGRDGRRDRERGERRLARSATGAGWPGRQGAGRRAPRARRSQRRDARVLGARRGRRGEATRAHALHRTSRSTRATGVAKTIKADAMAIELSYVCMCGGTRSAHESRSVSPVRCKMLLLLADPVFFF